MITTYPKQPPNRRDDPRLSNPITYGGGCLVLMLRLALVLVLGTYLMVLTGRVTDAQSPQPTMYTIGQYDYGNWSYEVQWFETERDQCYVAVRRSYESGIGISCLRKESK